MTSPSVSAPWRRGTGLLCLASFPLALVVALVEAWRPIAWGLAFVGFAGPYLAMIGHLNLSRELSPDEKSAWRRELWWSHRSFAAVWTYLLTADLRGASRELVENAREWWRP